jgi:hypothetical protein
MGNPPFTALFLITGLPTVFWIVPIPFITVIVRIIRQKTRRDCKN